MLENNVSDGLLARTMSCAPANEAALRGLDEVESCTVMQSPIVEVL